MARASLPLIRAIRTAAKKLEASSQYQWGHMGACNCGFLAQEVTRLSKDEIHRRAMLGQGDWSEQLNDYFPAKCFLFYDVIAEQIRIRFDTSTLLHSARLS